jgi:hypothetical protein
MKEGTPMTGQIEAGAMVECADYPLGTVERVDTDDGDGALFVRPARADYLLKIPVSLIAETSAGLVKLKATLQDVEQYALTDEAARPTSREVTTQAADPGPRSDEVLIRPPGEPPTSPATG